MLRGPRSVPAITRLGGGTISTIGDAQPYRVLGNEAVVYQLRQATGKVLALRCWLNDAVDPEIIERYRALSKPETLRGLHEVANSPIVPSITMYSDGINLEAEDLHSEAKPVVVLDWLMGPTVLAAVDRAAKASDTGYLGALASAWRRAALAAAEVGFVHGDLAPENAILRPKEGIAYVDYDTAFWSGAPSVPKLNGSPAYTHPRQRAIAPQQADHFAAYVVYVSLRILALWPALRAEHGQPTTVKGGALLFQPKDLASPDGSVLFGKLRVLDDPIIRGLVGMLREFCLGEAADVPAFSEALNMAARLAESQPFDIATPHRQSKVGSVLSSAAASLWETARTGTDRLRAGHQDQPPPDLEESWPEQRPTWRPERLEPLAIAIRQGDIDRAEEEWEAVKDEAGASALLPSLEALRSRAGRSGTSPLGRRVQRDEDERQANRVRFINALDNDDRETLREMALSGALDDIDDLSEEATRRLIATLAVAHLERALTTDDDVLIIDAWDDNLFADGKVISSEQRERVDLAFDRRAWLTHVRAALRKRDLDRIEDLFADMPQAAEARLTEREKVRIARLRDQRTSVRELRTAVFREHDGEVVRTLREVERLGAPIPDDMPWNEITSVVNRYALLASIRKVIESPPLDLVRLATLLPQIKDANGGVYPDVGGSIDFDQLDLMVKRSAQMNRLRKAIQSGNERSIVTTAYPDLYNVIPALDRTEQARIERAVASVNRALRRSGQAWNKSDSSSGTDVATLSGPAA
jgi:hypothetical protein